MAQKLNPFSGRQFLDKNGDPYVGAKLFCYEAGTSTKYTLTKDSAGASNHVNPIILNARGEPGDGAGASQTMWQTEGQNVKLVLAPSTDSDPPISAISTWDNLEPINDTTVVITDEWFSGTAPTYISATSFSVVGDQSSVYHVGRRIKTTNTGGTIYSSITNVAYTTVTTITVENDSGTLDTGLSALWYSILSADNTATPGGTYQGDITFADTIATTGTATTNGNLAVAGGLTASSTIRWAKGADVASAAALTLGTDGNIFDITGTTAITSIGTLGIGTVVKLHFDDVLTLTHNATDLILLGGENITTAAGDEAEFYEYASGDWICANYERAANTPGSGVPLLQAETATTSGTSHDYTSIPSWVKRITIMLEDVSTNGTNDLQIQIGDSGGIETTGYTGVGGTSALSSAFSFVDSMGAAFSVQATITLELKDATNNTWCCNGIACEAATPTTWTIAGNKSLSATLDRIRLTTAGGTQTFDAGSFTIMYE